MGICNALARQYGCAVRTPLEATVRSGKVYAPKAVSFIQATLVIKEVEWRQLVNEPDEYSKKYFTWQENEWGSDHILVLGNWSTICV